MQYTVWLLDGMVMYKNKDSFVECLNKILVDNLKVLNEVSLVEVTEHVVRLNGLKSIDLTGFKYNKYVVTGSSVLNAEKNKTSFVLICDNKFTEATVVAVNSCIRSAGKVASIHIFAIDSVSEVAAYSKFLNIGSATLCIYELQNVFWNIESYKGLVTSASLYKFLIPYLIKEQDRVLYIDSDVVVLNDVESLYEYDFCNNYAVVVQDIVGTELHREHERINADNYFNSGVMLLNLDLMRVNKLPEQMIELKVLGSQIKYMDQDVFNICFGSRVIYADPYYNYMTTNKWLEKESFSTYFDVFEDDKLKIIHYTFEKPWFKSGVNKSKFWYEEYKKTFNRAHPLCEYRGPTEGHILAESFLNSFVRNNSVLVIEPNNCHGEIAPGIVIALRQLGYFVDVVFTKNNYKMNPLKRIIDYDPTISVYNNFDSCMFMMLDFDKLQKYELVFFTSRSLYRSAVDFRLPNVYERFDVLKKLGSKLICLEHHLEYLNENLDTYESFCILANPSNKAWLESKIVNFPVFGTYNKSEKNEVTTFIVVGAIEANRKNHSLLMDTLMKLDNNGLDFKLVVVASRGELNIPSTLVGKVKFYPNVDYGVLYGLVESSDYILALLDYDNVEHHRYLTSGTSGTFQLSHGFNKPCIVQSEFASVYGFDNKNSIVHCSNNDFYDALTRAISLDDKEYNALKTELECLTNKIWDLSVNNLNLLIGK